MTARRLQKGSAAQRRGSAQGRGGAEEAPETLDELDLALIELFRKNPKISNTAVSNQLKIAKTTVATRVRRLSEQNVMRVVASFDVGAVGYDLLAIVTIRVRGRTIEAVAADLAQMPEALSVQSVLGPCDLVLIVAARTRRHLLQVLESEIGSVAGVDGLACDLLLASEVGRPQWSVLAQDISSAAPRSFFDEFDRGDDDAEFDEIDRVVIADLQQDGRTPLTRIARHAGVSEGTIRARVKRLEAQKHLQILALVDARRMGYVTNAFLRVGVYHKRLSAAARAFARMPPAISFVATSHSGMDIWLFALARSRAALLSLVSERVGAVPGVLGVTPFEVVQYFKLDQRWVMQLD